MRGIGAVALSFVGLWHGSIVLAEDGSAQARFVTCPFETPAERTVECFRVTLPLGGGGMAGTMVDLFAMVGHARTPGDHAPVVYLDGGPGGMSFLNGDAVGVWWWLLGRYPFLGQRDLVVFAQRGSPPSEPSIDCPAFKTASDRVLALGPSHRGGASDDRLEAIVGCAATLRDRGIELDAFSTPYRAADVPALLRALGYARWTLWGASYGTHLALTILRDHPEGTVSLVLDSTMVPHVVADLVPADKSRHRRRLFEACARDAACTAHFPDLSAMFDRAARRLRRDPIVWASEGDEPGPRSVVVDDAVLREMIEIAAYDTTTSHRVPAALDAAARGDYDPLLDLVDLVISYEREDGMASLALDARWCAEARPFLDPALAPTSDVHDLKHANVPDGATYCAAIGVGPLGRSILAPVTSDVPVLLLAGTLDSVTPPSWAHEAARTLSRATVVEFPGRAHAFAFGDTCAMTVIEAFLDDPGSTRETPCLATLAPPPFAVRP